MIDVLIDAVRLGQSPGRRGIGTYLRNLIAGLVGEPEIRLTAIATPHTALPDDVARVDVARRAPPRWFVQEHRLLLPSQLRRVHADVFHSPAFDPPRKCPIPWVQTVHDLIPFEADRASGTNVRHWARYARRLRAAAAVIAVSKWSAERAIELADLDPGQVHVIYNGVDPSFGGSDPDPDMDNPYILYVSAWSPYKGHAEALEVISRLADEGYPHRLKMAGTQSEWTLELVREEIAKSGHPERVDLLGFVDDLPALYRRATALVITSRKEGFGLPAIEAMASGTPVVAFDNSALTEVVDGGGVLVPDGDVAGMVAAVRLLLDSAEIWLETSQRGRERAREFDWIESARAHADVFKAIACD